MGKPKVRVLDNISGVCAHIIPPVANNITGIITSGATSVLINNKPTATVTSNVVTTCPVCGSGIIMAGDNTVLVENKPIAVVTSSIVLGSGSTAIALKGSNNVL